VKLLLDRVENVAAVDSEGFTPLHYAVRSCNWEAVDLLLEKIEPCNLILQQKGTQILMEAVKHLKSKGIPVFDEEFSRLKYFVENSHEEVVTLLLEEGKPFIAGESSKSQMDWLIRLLHLAKAVAIQMCLLRAFGQTIQSNHSEKCVNGLIDSSDIILTFAARTNHWTMIKCILRLQPEGFNINARSAWDDDRALVATPLHFAVLRGHVEAVDELLNHPQVNINAEDNKKVTPLMCAIKKGNWEMVLLLFFKESGSHLVGNENPDGQNPLQVVVEAKMKELENKLMERPLVKDFVDRLYRDRQVLVDAANALLVGAALIASVTFAGWLQPPLGYATYYDFSQPSPAPPGTYESYAAVKQHPSVKSFWVFNSLSFFFAIATVLAGAEAAMPSLQHAFIGRDVQSAKRALIITSIFLVMSVVCVLGAFASAGFAVLPPLLKYDTSMIITVCVGGTVCMLTLAKFLWKLAMPMRMRLLTIFRGEDLDPRLPAVMDVRTWHMSAPDFRALSHSGAMAI
jgi:ankyrin repeat protein